MFFRDWRVAAMSDGYKQGHDKGKTDAQANKDRDIRPPVVKAVVKGDDYVKSYMDGYKEGYRQGRKD
jgi:flagellar biosynthesis/type III secretory pathway protein FliH